MCINEFVCWLIGTVIFLQTGAESAEIEKHWLGTQDSSLCVYWPAFSVAMKATLQLCEQVSITKKCFSHTHKKTHMWVKDILLEGLSNAPRKLPCFQ